MIKIVKASVGALLSILVAELLNLSFVPSAGILTLLTLQNTKKETIFTALTRVGAFFIAMVYCSILFHFFGYSNMVFAVFLIFFTFTCYMIGFTDGISSSAVLSTHLLTAGDMTGAILMNEVLLLIVGVGIGIILNLFMPRTKPLVRKSQKDIDDKIIQLLNHLANRAIKDEEHQDLTKEFEVVEEDIQKAIDLCVENMNNTLFTDTRYYIQYMEMRQDQIISLQKVYDHLSPLDMVPSQAYKVAEFIRDIAASFQEYNNVGELILELNQLLDGLKDSELPVTREEFESRARLFLVLNELESFLLIKRKFIKNLSQKQLKMYWSKDAIDH